jgi:hypothetical protein
VVGGMTLIVYTTVDLKFLTSGLRVTVCSFLAVSLSFFLPRCEEGDYCRGGVSKTKRVEVGGFGESR